MSSYVCMFGKLPSENRKNFAVLHLISKYYGLQYFYTSKYVCMLFMYERLGKISPCLERGGERPSNHR